MNLTTLSLPAMFTAAAIASQVSVAYATISFNVPFNDLTTNGNPTAGQTATKPTNQWADNNAYGTLQLATQFPNGTGNNMALITSNCTSGTNTTDSRVNLFFQSAAADVATSGTFVITMDVYATSLSDGSSSGLFYVNLRDAGNNRLAGFNVSFSSGLGSFDTGDTSLNHGLSEAITISTVHHLKLTVDLDANKQTLTMDGTNLGSSSIRDGIDFRQLTINTSETSKGRLYIDNVVIQAVPEPAALGLLGVGAASLLALKHK